MAGAWSTTYPSRGHAAIVFITLSELNVTKDTQSLLINPCQHNIVGLDPRGVKPSGSVVDCWPKFPEGRAQFETLYYPGISNGSSTAIGTQFSAADIFGTACTTTVGGSNGTAAFVGTPAVVRDMLTYIKVEKAETRKFEAKLWYYGHGLRYGTVLGATTAHLFPDHVDRIILDGVVDAEDYYNLGWESNLYDPDKAIDSFIHSCYDAASVQNIGSRLDTLLEDLNPLKSFPNLGNVLSSLELGDTTAYATAVTSGATTANPCNYAISGSASTRTKVINTLIKCLDGYRGGKLENVHQFKNYTDILNSQSESFGEVWQNNANGVTCRSFEVTAPKTGRLDDINRPILDTRHTANPILFITTEIDLVSPKRGAHKMSSIFPGSVILIQGSVGHTAFASASTCVLLAANVTCQPDAEPFRAP
ncbi:hypothetical protein BDW59DRAFT_180585 [Aspergillus cavernicola]|uniref:Peptidase S33 tripeptidyl aminopeptidase-like C-terminal domain-containing protein n=1 Tax=Aspergillus cavernicola TaxID=176166 RepID=A0ABR4I754_9EURO